MKKITLLFALLLFTVFNYTAQAAESQTAVCTAGNLATVAASYLTTVTDLTVTGTINARDFVTMRDEMPLLEVIDLSGATVDEYTGADGPAGAMQTFYPQNAIPALSFTNANNYSGKTSLTTFIFPKDVSIISGAAFYNCSGLSGHLTIPSTVTIIENAAYYQCTGLTGSLTIPSSILSVGESAFYGCTGLTGNLEILANLTTIKREMFAACKFTGLLIIPESVTTIEIGAFSGCSGFTGNLVIPSLVSTIGGNAFANCEGIAGNIVIPESVNSIGNGAFNTCKGLFLVANQNSNYSSLDGVLFNKDKTTLIRYPKAKIGSYTIPSSVQIIESNSFSHLTTLTGSLIIPETVTTIGDFAFSSNIGLTAITIPTSVTSIGVSAFMACNDLVSIISLAPTPLSLGSFAATFDAINKTACTLYVPLNSKSLYAEANQWKTFTNIVEGFPTSLNEVLNSTISIYPNPTTSYITLSELSSLLGDNLVTLSIIDMLGNTLMVKEVDPAINTLSIDVNTLKNGIYFISVQASNASIVKRFVKE